LHARHAWSSRARRARGGVRHAGTRARVVAGAPFRARPLDGIRRDVDAAPRGPRRSVPRPSFADTDLPACAACGSSGSAASGRWRGYTGRSMEDARAGMALTGEGLDRFAADLVLAFDGRGVPPEPQQAPLA